MADHKSLNNNRKHEPEPHQGPLDSSEAANLLNTPGFKEPEGHNIFQEFGALRDRIKNFRTVTASWLTQFLEEDCKKLPDEFKAAIRKTFTHFLRIHAAREQVCELLSVTRPGDFDSDQIPGLSKLPEEEADRERELGDASYRKLQLDLSEHPDIWNLIKVKVSDLEGSDIVFEVSFEDLLKEFQQAETGNALKGLMLTNAKSIDLAKEVAARCQISDASKQNILTLTGEKLEVFLKSLESDFETGGHEGVKHQKIREDDDFLPLYTATYMRGIQGIRVLRDIAAHVKHFPKDAKSELSSDYSEIQSSIFRHFTGSLQKLYESYPDAIRPVQETLAITYQALEELKRHLDAAFYSQSR